MKCPSCRETLSAGSERCAACGAIVAPLVEGALAPVPRALTPPPRRKVEPLRDIPGMPRRERTWRDEVEERVARRRKKRTQSSLPLFEQPAVTGESEEPPATEELTATEEPTATVVEATPSPVPAAPPPAELAVESLPPMELSDPGPIENEFEAAPLSEEELADLPLRSAEPPLEELPEEGSVEIPPVEVDLPPDTPSLEDRFFSSELEDEAVSLSPPPPELSPLERPARVGERAQAAAVDAGILVVLGALVLYFTGRAARVDVLSLTVSWPWVASYLAFLGLFYAGYFTGTTGQTPGKMMTGLRVVDTRGRPPGYLRAALRAAAGALGTALAGLGLVPMALDPARRALHDRLASTRVVHR
jgi:uncharacterized RDD family membrane protein YckC